MSFLACVQGEVKGVDQSVPRFLTNEEVGRLQVGQYVGFVQFGHNVLARVEMTYPHSINESHQVKLSVEASLEYEGRGEYRSGIGWGKSENLFWLDDGGMQLAPPDWQQPTL